MNTYFPFTYPQIPRVYLEIKISDVQKATYSLLPAFHVSAKATSVERLLQNWNAWKQISYILGEAGQWIPK